MSFKPYIARVNTQLAHYLSDNNALTEMMRYSVLAGGKRFRPILSYATADDFNLDLSQLDASVCALEFIHAYSLIHDDLPSMDNDDIRHNQPACHKKFGEALAILSGDALQALAFEVMLNDNKNTTEVKLALSVALAKATFEMAQGQAIDLSVVGKDITLQDLQTMHRKKTGALIVCAVRLGAIVTNCSVSDQKALEIFAQSIGLAYQIQDDILDVEVPKEILGKAQNSDIENNKPTYPALLGLEEAKRQAKTLYEQAFDALGLLSIEAKNLQHLAKVLQNRAF
jgi:farnesyl diphosphate synthase/geranylgeranyl diphosphate synthase type II